MSDISFRPSEPRMVVLRFRSITSSYIGSLSSNQRETPPVKLVASLGGASYRQRALLGDVVGRPGVSCLLRVTNLDSGKLCTKSPIAPRCRSILTVPRAKRPDAKRNFC